MDLDFKMISGSDALLGWRASRINTERRLHSGWGGEHGDREGLLQGTGKRWEGTMMPLTSDG